MSVRLIDHVGVVVDDLLAARTFFVDLGFEVQSEGESTGAWLDRIVGLTGVRTAFVMLQLAAGQAKIELVKFHMPPDDHGGQRLPANTPGLRHLALVVDDIDAIVARLRAKGDEIFSEVQRLREGFKLCYVRGPEGIILELAEPIG